MTAIEDADRLNDTRRSGTKMNDVGGSVGIYETIANLPWDTEDPKNRSEWIKQDTETNRTCKQRRAGAIHRRKSTGLEKDSGTATAAAWIGRTIIQGLFLHRSAVSRWKAGINWGGEAHLHVTIVDGSKSGVIGGI